MSAWTVTVPTAEVDSDGMVTVVAEVSRDGVSGSMTWTLTADGASRTVLDIDGLSRFDAWSMQ